MIPCAPVVSFVTIKLTGVAYPVYAAFKATSSKTQATNTAFWLQYFAIFCLFALIEPMLDLVGPWLPLCYELKVVFVVWLQLPKYRGAQLLFDKYLTPALAAHEANIDWVLERAKNVTLEDAHALHGWAKVQGEVLIDLAAGAQKPTTKKQKPTPAKASATAGAADKPREKPAESAGPSAADSQCPNGLFAPVSAAAGVEADDDGACSPVMVEAEDKKEK